MYRSKKSGLSSVQRTNAVGMEMIIRYQLFCGCVLEKNKNIGL